MKVALRICNSLVVIQMMKQKKKADEEAKAAGAAAAGEPSKFPAALFAAYAENPVFADLVKSNVTAAEIVPAFNLLGNGLSVLDPMALIPGGAPPVDVKFAAALIYFYVDTQEKKEEEVTFSAHYTDDDKAELDDIAASEGKKAFVFPGVIEVNGDTAPAATDKAKNKYTFTVKTKVFEHAEKKYFARLIATADKDTTDNKVKLTESAALKLVDVAAWKAKLAA